ncbi:hypothetical protein Gotur_028468 [Gossypium turneri]
MVFLARTSCQVSKTFFGNKVDFR